MSLPETMDTDPTSRALANCLLYLERQGLEHIARNHSGYGYAQRMVRQNISELLSLVTVCRNNPRELDATLQSVSAQSVPPDFHIVVDSSDEVLRGHMETICERYGVRYLWCEPEGVYPAMRRGLESVPPDSLVWFLNSSDYLFSENSLQDAMRAVSNSPPDTQWWVGRVAYTGRGGPIQPIVITSAEDFLTKLRAGRSGFPHAGSIVRNSALTTVNAFTDGFDIAGDYAVALRLGKEYGPPVLIESVLSVFDRGGLSGTKPIKTAWEKSVARRRHGGQPAREVYRFLILGVRGVFRWLAWRARRAESFTPAGSASSALAKAPSQPSQARIPLSIVTVSFNNPEELSKTLASVYKQSIRPSHHVVIDSSDEAISPQMKKMARMARAQYVWVEPAGVYAAMRESLHHTPDDCYIWWVNSSDWLAGKDSVRAVVDYLAQFPAGAEPHWLVGNLLRLNEKSPTLHRRAKSARQFVSAMAHGTNGFPHPVTIFRKSLLQAVEPYGEGLSIASDYATALRFGKRFGSPDYIDATLTAHDPTGLTSQHPLRNQWEKSKARRIIASYADRVLEPIRLLKSLAVGVFTRVVGEGRLNRIARDLPSWPLIDNQHFCGLDEQASWPRCCNSALDAWET